MTTGEAGLYNPQLAYRGIERRSGERRTGRTDRRMPEFSLEPNPLAGRRKSSVRKYDTRKKPDKKIPRIVFRRIISRFNHDVKQYARIRKVPLVKARKEYIELLEKDNRTPGIKFLHYNILYIVVYHPRTRTFTWSSTQRIGDRRQGDRRDPSNLIETQADPENN